MMLLTGAHLCHRCQQQLWISDISSRNRRWQCALQLILRPDLYLWCIESHCALGPIFCITGLGSSSLPIALVTIVTSTIYVINAKSKVKKNWKARSGGCRLSPTTVQTTIRSAGRNKVGLITRPELPVIQFWDFYSPTSQHSKFYNRTYFFL